MSHFAAYSWARTSTFAISKDMLWTIQQLHKSKTLVWLLQYCKSRKGRRLQSKNVRPSKWQNRWNEKVSGSNWSETKERKESHAICLNHCCYYRCSLFVTVNISAWFLISHRWRRLARESILCEQKWFWSASEALLSNGHQWKLVYDFLVNTAVDFMKVRLGIFLEMCTVFLRLSSWN